MIPDRYLLTFYYSDRKSSKILGKIFWNFATFYYKFVSPYVKRFFISSTRVALQDAERLRFKKIGNIKKNLKFARERVYYQGFFQE